MSSYRDALAGLTADAERANRALAQNNLGRTLRLIVTRGRDPARLADAVAAYRATAARWKSGEGLFSAPFPQGASAGEIHVNDFDLEPPTARPRAASVFDSFGLFDLTPDLAIRKFLGVDVEVPLSRLEIGELLVAYIGGPFHNGCGNIHNWIGISAGGSRSVKVSRRRVARQSL